MPKILIVDDNLSNRLAIKILLKEFPECTISEATNGKEAVQACIDEAFDLVFMDIMMPEMDGIEATRHIKSFDQIVLIVAVSALGEESKKEAILRAGADDYITKPINDELFRHRFSNYLKIIQWRKAASEATTQSVNLFYRDVFPKAILFRIYQASSLPAIWEYFSLESALTGAEAADALRALYQIGELMLSINLPFELIVEEDKEYYYFTLRSTKEAPIERIQPILHNEISSGGWKIDNYGFSLKVAKNSQKRPSIPTPSRHPVDSKTLEILRYSHTQKVSANEYVTEMALEFLDKLEMLDALEEQIDQQLFDFEHDHDMSHLNQMGEGFKEYAAVIELLIEFQHLAYAISSLGDFLLQLPTLSVTDSQKSKLSLILRGILSDLANWRTMIFIKQEANDIHYLDSSLLSSCLQAKMLFETLASQEETSEGEDLELF
ncbi:MAG: response regulator [Campylobacterales bacterium]